MEIIETSVFTRQVQAILSNEEYRQLQLPLVIHPDMGAVIPGSGRLRKMRWTIGGRGKRGGVRVIYYWAVLQDRILMLFMYTKK
jgi:mRNA-degrading endonuclease RelE of RelBE toxin-antitoxin system